MAAPDIPATANNDEAEPPDWMAVETDFVVRLRFPGEVLQDAVVVEGTPLRPCVILPEDVPDDGRVSAGH